MNAFASLVAAEAVPQHPAMQHDAPVHTVEAFREAMARHAGAVAIVAVQDQGRVHGLLVSSMTVLSLEPPRVLFCVRKEASCHDLLLEADRVSLAVLSAQDRAEAETFVRSEHASSRFASPSWRRHPVDPPHFQGGLISLKGSIHQKICAGTHTIFIVDIEQSTFSDGEPLLYFNRGFHRLAPS